MLIPSSLHHFQVDLFQLQVNTLRRYKRHYKLQTRPGLNKAQLAEVSDDRGTVISAIKKPSYLLCGSADFLDADTCSDSLASTYHAFCGRFQGMAPTGHCMLAPPEAVTEDVEADS